MGDRKENKAGFVDGQGDTVDYSSNVIYLDNAAVVVSGDDLAARAVDVAGITSTGVPEGFAGSDDDVADVSTGVSAAIRNSEDTDPRELMSPERRRAAFDSLRENRNRGSVVNLLLEDEDFTEGVSDSQRSFFWQAMFSKEAPDESFYCAVNYFDELVREFGLSDAPLFRDREVRDDLRKRLHEFMQYVDRKLNGVAFRIRGSEKCSNFSDNWRKNLKLACYFVFLIHYTEKRKGELDDDGVPVDYVYHPVRSAFDNLVARVRFFCEPTVIADIFHDAGENWKSGFLGMLEASRKREVKAADFGRKSDWLCGVQDVLEAEKSELFGRYFGHVCHVLTMSSHTRRAEEGQRRFSSSEYLSQIVGIRELVEILTKGSDNRARAIVEMLSKICKYSGAAMFSAARALLIKMTDRLDNIKSLKSLSRNGRRMGGPSEERISEISHETIYFFTALAIALKAWNVVDWLYDYIAFSDPEKRTERIDLRKRSDSGIREGAEIQVLKTGFRSEFERELRGRMGDASISDGRDYVLEFRPVGMRYERSESASDAADRGTYARHLQNFIVFRCGEKDPSMLVAASEVFRRIFSKPLNPDVFERGEFGSVFGEKLMHNRMGVPEEENGYSDKYGVGAWSVFNGPEDLSAKVLGDVNRGYFYSDSGSDTDDFLAVVESCGNGEENGADFSIHGSKLGVLFKEGIPGFASRFPSRFAVLSERFPALVAEIREKGVQAVFGTDDVDAPARAARARVLALLNGIKPFVDLLKRQYDFIDCLRVRLNRSAADVAGGVRREIFSVDIPELGAVSFSGGINAQGIGNIEAVVGKLVMTMFMEKPITAKVKINGGTSCEVQLPADCVDLNSAIVFGAPWALGREVLSVEESAREGGTVIFNITVDLNKPFDPSRFVRQIEFMDRLLADYKKTLLLDKYSSVRDEVFSPGAEDVSANLVAAAESSMFRRPIDDEGFVPDPREEE